MLRYILHRVGITIITLAVISIISFVIIQLPPGDMLTTWVAHMEDSGEIVEQERVDTLRRRYGLDQPLYVQYWRWISGVMVGDFGHSFMLMPLQVPVGKLIWHRLGLTVAIALLSILITWIVAVPIGVYSATHQYKFFDYLFTLFGFVGMSTPPFLLALVLMYVANVNFDTSVGGLFSDEFVDAPWSWARVIDFLKHVWIPVLVLGLGSTAELIRTIRANLLDELRKPYVITARSKGVSPWKLLFKYPVRIAINPVVSTIGWMLPTLVSGSVIVAMVLNLPTTGPLMLKSLMGQDMFLAGSFVMMLATLTVIGTLLSDILLAWTDPRIRYE